MPPSPDTTDRPRRCRQALSAGRFEEAEATLEASLHLGDVPSWLAVHAELTQRSKRAADGMARHAVAVALEGGLERAFAEMPPEGLVPLDANMRARMFDPERWDSYRALEVETWLATLPDAPRTRAALVAFGTMHPRGRVRERALGELRKLDGHRSVWMALLRLNDWVEPVHEAACAIVYAQLRDRRLDAFADALPLVLRLADAGRRPLTSTADRILEALVTHEDGRLVEQTMTVARRLPRTLAFRLAFERGDEPLRRRAADLASRDPEYGIRLLGAAHGLLTPEQRARAATDSHPAIAQRGLRAQGQHGEGSVEAFRRAAFSRNRGLRWVGLEALRDRDAGFVAVDAYRECLAFGSSGDDLVGAIEGLGDVGSPDDAAYSFEYIVSPVTTQACAALAVTHALDHATYVDALVDALADPRPTVAQVAARALVRDYVPLPRLDAVLRASPATHTARLVLGLVRAFDLWERFDALLALADAVGDARRSVLEAKIDHVARCALRGLYRPPAAPITTRRALEVWCARETRAGALESLRRLLGP